MIKKYSLFMEAFSTGIILKDETIKSNIHNGDYIRLLFLYKEKVIGELSYTWTNDQILKHIKSDIKGELYIVDVRTRAKRKGVGSQLVQSAIQDAKDLGLHKVTLKLPNDGSDVSGLKIFYEKLGFKYWGKIMNSEFMYLLI